MAVVVTRDGRSMTLDAHDVARLHVQLKATGAAEARLNRERRARVVGG